MLLFTECLCVERVDGTIKSEEGFLEELSFDLEF